MMYSVQAAHVYNTALVLCTVQILMTKFWSNTNARLASHLVFSELAHNYTNLAYKIVPACKNSKNLAYGFKLNLWLKAHGFKPRYKPST